jgi:hypothetical protein
MWWEHTTPPRAKQFKVCQSHGKVMASAFWDAKEVFYVEFMP